MTTIVRKSPSDTLAHEAPRPAANADDTPHVDKAESDGTLPKPRIVFAALQEPRHRLSFSGAFHLMLRALHAEGFEVDVPGHAIPLAVRLKRMIPLGRFHSPVTRAPHDVSAAVASSVSGPRSPSVVFAPLASELVPMLPPHVPVVYFSDATPRLLQGGYESHDRANVEQLARWDALELAATRRADRIVYSSRWAADSAVRDYGVPRDHIVIAPYGSPLEPARGDALARKLSTRLRLLWVGAHWERKGGAKAVEVLRALRAAGVDVELHMCGARGPGWNADRVIHHGFVDRGKRSHRGLTLALMRRCHVFLLPTRADCSPLVLAEAAAWGMPAVTTTVGGIPEIVDHGETGLLLDPGSPAVAFADAVRAITDDATTYATFVERGRNAYERRITWRQWAKLVGRALCLAHASRRDHEG